MDKNQIKIASAYYVAAQSAAERLIETLEKTAKRMRDLRYSLESGNTAEYREKSVEVAEASRSFPRQLEAFNSAMCALNASIGDLIGEQEAQIICSKIEQMFMKIEKEAESASAQASSTGRVRLGFV